MSTINSYKNLLVWQKSMDLVTEVYSVVRSLPNDESYGLMSQIKRSVISVPSNIAEGYGRTSKKAYIQFLRISRGSLIELETQLLICLRLEFIKEEKLTDIFSHLEEISKMLNSLIKKLEETSLVPSA